MGTLEASDVTECVEVHALRLEDLDPVNKNGEVIDWWVAMMSSRRSEGVALSAHCLLEVPIETELGRGQYGRVWRARDRRTGELYAVKNMQARGQQASTV